MHLTIIAVKNIIFLFDTFFCQYLQFFSFLLLLQRICSRFFFFVCVYEELSALTDGRNCSYAIEERENRAVKTIRRMVFAY
jgi:hypothetical protein